MPSDEERPNEEMEKALADQPFPVVEIARLIDSLVDEFQTLEGQQKMARGPYFVAAFQAIGALSSNYTKIVETRNGKSLLIH